MDKTEEDVLCERIEQRLNPEELVDILGLEIEEVVEALRSYIIEHKEWEDVL